MRILALSMVTAIFVITVGLGWLFDLVYVKYWQTEQDKPLSPVTAIEKFGSDLQTTINNSNLPENELNKLINNWPQTSDYRLTLVPFDSFPLPSELQVRLKQGEPLTLASEDDLSIYYYLANNQHLLQISSPVLVKTASGNLNRYVFTGLFYLCLLSLMLLWLYPLINRLLTLRTTTKAFGQGELDQRIEVGSISYIRDLELEFNHMAQRINDLVGDVKLLSSAVSHDLRTPLATIRFGIDTLQEEDDPVLRQKFQQRISDNVDEMIELVEILLNYARLDQNLVTLDKGQLSIDELLSQVVSTFAHLDTEIHLNHITDVSTINADKKYLAMLFKNLIQNALQHCNSKVSIEIKQQAQQVLVSVADDGKGIDESQKEHIVKPFIRGNAEHKGYGVGLAIVQRILHWHHGELRISNDKTLGGARFEVYLPIGGKR